MLPDQWLCVYIIYPVSMCNKVVEVTFECTMVAGQLVTVIIESC